MAPESLEPHSGRIVEIAVESLLEASWALSSHLPSVLDETYSVDEHTGLIPVVMQNLPPSLLHMNPLSKLSKISGLKYS